eukprot:1161258-Pelagomonas_calceolata.AAC.3
MMIIRHHESSNDDHKTPEITSKNIRAPFISPQVTGLAWCTPVSCHPRMHTNTSWLSQKNRAAFISPQITGLAWCTPVSCHPRLHACEVSVDASDQCLNLRAAMGEHQ